MRLFLLTSLTMVAFSANSILNRMAVGAGQIDSVSFALVRVVGGTVMLMVLINLKNGIKRPSFQWLPVLGLVTYLLGFSVSYQRLDAGTGALILFGVVQMTMFAGAISSGEKVRITAVAGAVISLTGLAFLLAPGAFAPDILSAALMILAGIGWGIYSLQGRGIRDPLAATGANFLYATPVVALVWLGLGPDVSASRSGIFLAVLSGAVTSALGYALWYQILPQLKTSVSAVAQLTVPVITVALGAILLAEPLTLKVVISSALVLGGVALAVVTAQK